MFIVQLKFKRKILHLKRKTKKEKPETKAEN